MTIYEMRHIYRAGQATYTFADVWTEIMMVCNNWQIANHGPKIPFPPPEQISTSYPLLFLTNTHDPVGPIECGHIRQ